ncbi:MAG: hydrolase 2, exosortase A system-associated [Paucibacter sp.]|nr:hydrolase 2, exosortase A system-associated [Roseateles sp.]
MQVAESGGGGPGGQRLCVFHRAHGARPRGRVVHVHALAEEMHKSRRMVALQSRGLAEAGYSVLQIDLLGCGDSSGDFGDASWAAWAADVLRACDWLRRVDDDHAAAPLWLWGHRAGALVAVDAARQLQEPAHFCFWQPPAAGKTLLQQFLRLKLAAEMQGGGAKGLMEQMRQQLAAGQCVEIAGYALSPELAQGLEAARLQPPGHHVGRVEWLELDSREDASLSPVSAQTQAQWSAAGWAVRSQLLRGPAFWQTTEIEDAPALLAATSAALAAEPA